MADNIPEVIFRDTEIVRDNVRVVLEDVGEGVRGDYNAYDPTDIALLRFTVYVKPRTPAEADELTSNGVIFSPENTYDDSGWIPVEDASYCTLVPAKASLDERNRVLEVLMGAVYEPLSSGNRIKKVCELLSWINRYASY